MDLQFFDPKIGTTQLSGVREKEFALGFQLLIGSRGRSIPRTVLIVDSDLGFVFWLGHFLDAAKFLALPAKSVPEAALLAMQLDLTVDVLVVNLALPGATDFIAALRRSNSALKAIGVFTGSSYGERAAGVNATYSKPTNLDEVARAEWLAHIEDAMQKSAECASRIIEVQ